MKRVLTGTVLIALVVALIDFEIPALVALFSAIVATLAALEFRDLCQRAGFPVSLWWTILSVPLFVVTLALRVVDPAVMLSLLTLALFGWNTFRLPLKDVLGSTAAGLLGLVYIAYPLALIPRILAQEDGTALLLFLFLCVWCGDIAALYVGRSLGRHKLAPSISPNKTWEGTLASVAGSLVFGMALVLAGDWFTRRGSSFTRLHTSWPWWTFALLAVLLNAAAQVGDLAESAVKRGVGVKDSGTLLPGHGGVLDRIDAMLFAAPVLWLVLVLHQGL